MDNELKISEKDRVCGSFYFIVIFTFESLTVCVKYSIINSIINIKLDKCALTRRKENKYGNHEKNRKG